MTPNELFQPALQRRGTPWRVVRSDFSGEPPTLEIGLDFARGSRFPCPQCGELCGAYDTLQKRWRHLNFFQYRCELVAAVPRLRCPEHGVHLVSVPWASEGSGFTLLFEAFVMLLAEQMPVEAISRLVWRLIIRVVKEAHAAADWSQVCCLAIDETSSRRGRWYVTVFLDAKTHRLLYVAEGRSSLAVEEFAQALVAHGGDCQRIQWVAMDMLHCYAKGVFLTKTARNFRKVSRTTENLGPFRAKTCLAYVLVRMIVGPRLPAARHPDHRAWRHHSLDAT